MLTTRNGGPLVTEEQVRLFEQANSLSLPAAYRSFLMARNGGRPERDVFCVPGCKGSPTARLHFLFGIGHPIRSYDLHWNLVVFGDRIPGELLPIGTTEGADLLCLGVKDSRAGQVVFWDGYQETGNRFYSVAPSIDEFFGLLSVDSDSPTLPKSGQ